MLMGSHHTLKRAHESWVMILLVKCQLGLVGCKLKHQFMLCPRTDPSVTRRYVTSSSCNIVYLHKSHSMYFFPQLVAELHNRAPNPVQDDDSPVETLSQLMNTRPVLGSVLLPGTKAYPRGVPLTLSAAVASLATNTLIARGKLTTACVQQADEDQSKSKDQGII